MSETLKAVTAAIKTELAQWNAEEMSEYESVAAIVALEDLAERLANTFEEVDRGDFLAACGVAST